MTLKRFSDAGYKQQSIIEVSGKSMFLSGFGAPKFAGQTFVLRHDMEGAASVIKAIRSNFQLLSSLLTTNKWAGCNC